MSESILDEAKRIVAGDRNDDYGDPADDLAHIGRCWGATLSSWSGLEIVDLPPHVVALLMVQLKVIRFAFKPKRDSAVDAVGYSLIADQCAEYSVPSQENGS